MNILVTWFEPFGKNSVNPSMEVLAKLKNCDKVLLPVSYDRVSIIIDTKLESNNYDYVILLGLAQGRKSISCELVALNYMKASIPDNDGVIYDGEFIDKNSENALFTKLNIKKLVKDLNNIQIDTTLSSNAGTYVCNRIYYHTLNNLSKTIFIHLPTYDELPLEKQITAIQFVIDNINNY